MAKKPQIRFKGFDKDWDKSIYSDQAETRRGLTYRPSSIRSKGIRVLRSSNIQDDKFVKSAEDVFVEKDAINIEYAKNHDILITSANGSPRLVGKHCLINNIEDNSTVHGGFMLLARALNPFFLNASMSSEWYNRFIKFYVAGGNGAIGNLNKNDLDKQEILIPNTDEQSKIGEFFKALDELIGAKEEELEKLRQLKQALLQQMFPSDDTENVNGGGYKSLSNNYLGKNDMVISSVPNTPRIRFKGFTEPWDRKPLNSIGYTYNGLSGKRKEDFGHGKARYITYMNVFSHTIAVPHGVDSIEIDNNQNQVKYGDVLFTTSSETPDEVGMSSVWLGHEDNVYLNSFCFGYRPTITIYPYYLAYSLHTPRIRRCFYLLAQGISRFNISKQKAMNIKLDLPSFEEQRKVGDFFYEQDMVINASQDRINKLKIIKQSLLQKMFAA